MTAHATEQPQASTTAEESTAAREQRARRIIGWYTLAATATGMVPLPAATGAIVMSNGLMLGHIAAAMGQPVTWEAVLTSLGVIGGLNVAGRALFVEIAKALSWGTGNPLMLALVSAAGGVTAGVQTFAIGSLGVVIARSGGQAIPREAAARVIAQARATYKAFVAEMKRSGLTDPGAPPPECVSAPFREAKP